MLSLLSKQVNWHSQKALFAHQPNQQAVKEIMSNTNICWDCMHGTLKLEILVPNNCSINEYVRRTGNFESQIVAIVKSNQGQYDVWFRSAGTVRLLSFRMLHVCKLNHKRQTRKVVVCKNYDLKNERNQSATSHTAKRLTHQKTTQITKRTLSPKTKKQVYAKLKNIKMVMD